MIVNYNIPSYIKYMICNTGYFKFFYELVVLFMIKTHYKC